MVIGNLFKKNEPISESSNANHQEKSLITKSHFYEFQVRC